MKTTWQTEVYITLVESLDIYKHIGWKPHDKQVYNTLVESPDIYKHIGWKPHDKQKYISH